VNNVLGFEVEQNVEELGGFACEVHVERGDSSVCHKITKLTEK
jgi:hypothetical protein